MYECHPSVCQCGEKCHNQRFQRREYPDCTPFKTEGRGWGLRTNVDIKKVEIPLSCKLLVHYSLITIFNLPIWINVVVTNAGTLPFKYIHLFRWIFLWSQLTRWDSVVKKIFINWIFFYCTQGQFVHEYVGELIDEEEVKRRIDESHENNISNYYMLTLDKNRYTLYIFLQYKKTHMPFEWGKKIDIFINLGKTNIIERSWINKVESNKFTIKYCVSFKLTFVLNFKQFCFKLLTIFKHSFKQTFP